MQHLRVNFGGNCRFKLGFFIWVILLKKSGLIFKSPAATLHCHPPTESLCLLCTR